MNATVDVRHEPGASRFAATVDGHECELDYHLQDGVMTITHTGVPAAVGGRGIAAAMTEAALKFAREQKWRVRPACSYAATYMRRHPEFADLLA